MDPLAPPFRTRAAAWVVTGPLGHLWGGMADWVALFGRLAWGRVRSAAASRRRRAGAASRSRTVE